MNIRDINKPINSKTLNETMAKKYGKKIDVESFTLEQLQDARNKIRTKLSDIETNESFSGLSQNKTYSKNKLFLDVLNAAISERADIEVDESKPDFLDLDKDGDKKEPMKKAAKDADKAKGSKPKKGEVPPQFKKTNEETRDEKKARFKQARADKRIGDKMDKDAEATSPAMQKKKKTQNDLLKFAGVKQMDEGKEIINNYFKKLVEGEEDKAELVMAAKDMVDRLTGWMEDTAEMQSESMLELADAIRDEMGAQQSEAFTATVKPSLESLYAAMEATRVSLTQGVGMLTGEGEPAEPMGAEPMDPDMEPTTDMDAPVNEPAVDDGMGAAAPAAGGEDEAGRAKRESIQRSRRLGTILSSRS